MNEPVELLRFQIFSLTNVSPEKQIVVGKDGNKPCLSKGFKGGVLKDDAVLSALNIQNVRSSFQKCLNPFLKGHRVILVEASAPQSNDIQPSLQNLSIQTPNPPKVFSQQENLFAR